MANKTDKELIQELLDNINNLGSGLCNLALKVFPKNEAIRVIDLIYDNKPSHIAYKFFWWECGKIEPRRLFLINMIENGL